MVAKVSKATDKETLPGAVFETTVPGATDRTDEHKSYLGLDSHFDHRTVCRSAKQFVDGKVHTYGKESVWTVLRRGFKWACHSFSEKRLPRCVNEFVFRSNEGNCAVREPGNIVRNSTHLKWGGNIMIGTMRCLLAFTIAPALCALALGADTGQQSKCGVGGRKVPVSEIKLDWPPTEPTYLVVTVPPEEAVVGRTWKMVPMEPPKILLLEKGDTWKLTAETLPANATDTTIVWTTSDPDVVTISEGVMNAVGWGYATVAAETPDGRVRTECRIGVVQEIH